MALQLPGSHQYIFKIAKQTHFKSSFYGGSNSFDTGSIQLSSVNHPEISPSTFFVMGVAGQDSWFMPRYEPDAFSDKYITTLTKVVKSYNQCALLSPEPKEVQNVQCRVLILE